MISLDEEYIGRDNNTVVVRAVQVCAAVVGQLDNGHLFGLHFSSTVPQSVVVTGCTYVMNHWIRVPGRTVAHLHLILNLPQWQARVDRYGNMHNLVSDLKALFGFAGLVRLADKNMLGASIDVHVASGGGGAPAITYRVTPNPEAQHTVASNDVKQIHQQNVGGGVRSPTPTVRNTGLAFPSHRPSIAVGAYAAMPLHMFVSM